MRARWIIAGGAVWCAFGWLASAQTATPSEVVEHVDVISVEVPVQVNLDGRPVRGLTAANFQIYDGRRLQRIEVFRAIDLSLVQFDDSRDSAPAISIAGRRHFLVVFDLSFADPGSIARAREHVRDWALNSLHPSDLVAVATYGVNSGADLLLNFTSDRKQIALAVSTLGVPDLVERASDPLGLSFGVARTESLETSEFTSQLDGYSVAWDDDVIGGQQRDVFYGAFEPTQNQARRLPIRQMSQSFSGLARLLDSVKGRKYVVYLSEGFDSSLIFASDDMRDITQMNEAVQEGALWRVDSTKRFGSGPTQTEIQGMLEQFRRADCVIQAVDIKNFEEGNARRVLPSSADSLALMAHETGGELYRDYIDLGAALERLLEETSVTYLLSFTPDKLRADGSFHKLRVKLVDAPKGSEVRHRPGYFAPKPYDERDKDERRLIASQLILEGRDGGRIDTSILAAPFHDADGLARVPVLIEIDGPSLLLGARGGQMTAEIFAYAFDGWGALADYFTQTIQLDLAKVGPALRGQGLKFFGELELPSGEYSLRVLVLDRASGASGLRVSRLRVPDFTANEPVVLPPMFPEPRGKWLLAREARLDTAGLAFPFMLENEPYLPAALPALEQRSVARLCVLTYNLADPGGVRLEGRVFAVDGTEIKQLALPLRGRARGGVPGSQALLTQFDTGGLAVGRYTLVITVDDPRSGLRRSSSLPFSVVEARSG